MNERIKKLAEQAGATVITTHGVEGVVDGCYVIGPARLEKFAELIIRECGHVAYETYWNDPENVRGQHFNEKIKQHFGVEK